MLFINLKTYIEELKKQSNIIIYGTSTGGERIYKFLKEMNVTQNIRGFASTIKSIDTLIDDIPVLDLEELIEYNKQSKVYIIIASYDMEEIKDILLKRGIEESQIDNKGYFIIDKYRKDNIVQHLNEEEIIYGNIEDKEQIKRHKKIMANINEIIKQRYNKIDILILVKEKNTINLSLINYFYTNYHRIFEISVQCIQQIEEDIDINGIRDCLIISDNFSLDKSNILKEKYGFKILTTEELKNIEFTYKDINDFINFKIKQLFPKISIIILTYNQLNYTKMCIKSILEKTAYPNYEIIIVDNNSYDETPGYLGQIEKEYKQIKIILNNENVGFAAGNNIGIKHSTGDYIVLLNNDTIVTRGWLTNLIKHLEADKTLGMIGPVTNQTANEAQINISYSQLKDMDTFAYKYTSTHMNLLYDNINVLIMFCVMISRQVFNKVGYLDENYGMGFFEDDDYSYRLKKEGYNIACAEDVFIHHKGSASFKSMGYEQIKLMAKNKKIFEEKWKIKHKHSHRKDVE